MFNGKMKAVTFSYDDGVTQDRKFVEMLDKYNLKCTFNLNSEFLGNEGTITYKGVTVSGNKVLPDEIAFRKKLGFIVPIRLWLADERYNADVVRLLNSDICEKFFNINEVKAIFDEYIGGNSDNWRKVWTIYTFLLWYEEYFVKR